MCFTLRIGFGRSVCRVARRLDWSLLHILRLLESAAQFAYDGIAREAKFAQDFTQRPHCIGQMVRRYHDQCDDQNQDYFDYTQGA